MTDQFLQTLFSLKGKRAIVTGAAGYFGKAFTECLLHAGAGVVLLGRGEKIEAFASSLKENTADNLVDWYDVDLYDEKKYRTCLLDAIGKNGSIDILVNNAFEFSRDTGFNDPSGKMETIMKEQWLKALESGVYWYALSTQVVGEHMKNRKQGSIINISSMYALVSPDPNLYKGTDLFNPPTYSAVKAAIVAHTRYTASFYGEYNVRCNALLPGAFPNVDPDAYNSPRNEDFMKRLEGKTVLGRTGRLDDLKGALIFLASDSSSYMTGQNIVVDGGWTVR